MLNLNSTYCKSNYHIQYKTLGLSMAFLSSFLWIHIATWFWWHSQKTSTILLCASALAVFGITHQSSHWQRDENRFIFSSAKNKTWIMKSLLFYSRQQTDVCLTSKKWQSWRWLHKKGPGHSVEWGFGLSAVKSSEVSDPLLWLEKTGLGQVEKE